MNASTGPKAVSLDVGAGHQPRGDINVDLRSLPHLDAVCHATFLPFKDKSFGHVYLSHVVEHFQYAGVASLLREVKRILKDEGQLEIWTPNFQGLSFLRAWILGGMDKREFPLLFAPLSGDQDYKENVHLSHWSLKLMKTYLSMVGFKVLQASSEGNYKGALAPLGFVTKVFPNRGGIIHVLAVRTSIDQD